MSGSDRKDDDGEALADLAEEGFAAEGVDVLEAWQDIPSGVESLGSYEEEFRDFIADLNLRYFKYPEFLFLGSSHYAPTSKCRGLNSLPPKKLWTNMSDTARVLDELRHRLDARIRLRSIYRNSSYNKCLDNTASDSQHKAMRAADFVVEDGQGTAHWRKMLLVMRDKENFFSGGIGIYDTFVHVDTRGYRADWDSRKLS